NSKIEAALDELLGKLAAQAAGVPPQAAAAARQKLMAQFQEQAASVPPAELAAACVNRLVSLANPKPDDVKLLDGILSGHQPQPRYVETLFLRRLTALADQVPAEAWPAGLVRLAAHVVGKGEAACGFPGELAGI